MPPRMAFNSEAVVNININIPALHIILLTKIELISGLYEF